MTILHVSTATHTHSPDSLRLAVVGTAHDDVQGELVVMVLSDPPTWFVSINMTLTVVPYIPVFVELEQERVFEEFRIESQSENCILFEIDVTLLNTALISCKVRRRVWMMLGEYRELEKLFTTYILDDGVLVLLLHDIFLPINKPSSHHFYT